MTVGSSQCRRNRKRTNPVRCIQYLVQNDFLHFRRFTRNSFVMSKQTDDHPKNSQSKQNSSKERIKVKVSITGRISVDPRDVLRSDEMAKTLEQLKDLKISRTAPKEN